VAAGRLADGNGRSRPQRVPLTFIAVSAIRQGAEITFDYGYHTGHRPLRPVTAGSLDG
jgi:hypothetical protein